MAQTATTSTATNRSIAKATTSREVFVALVEQTAGDNIVTIGARMAGCEVTFRGKGFEQSNGKLKYECRTNKYLPSIEQALVDFREVYKKLDVDAAREAAYAISDQHGVVLVLWEDDPKFEGLTKGRKFNAVVRQRNYFSKQDGVDKTETFFYDLIMEEIVAIKGGRLNKADLLLEDDAAEDEVKTKALLNETNDFFADEDDVELTDEQILAQAKKDKAAKAKAAKAK